MNPEGTGTGRPPLLRGWGEGWIVVEKPSGMSVHNDPGRDLISIVAGWLDGKPDWIAAVKPDPAFGLHPVHRLDRDTSGLLLTACRKGIFNLLSRQFESREVEKTYQAVVHGHLPDTGGWAEWSWPLSLSPGGRSDPAGSGKRQPCATRFRVLRLTAHYTLIQCRPVTGRKHQIRRHAALAGHPIAGDARYGSTRAVRFLRRERGFDRLGLHADGLCFTAPEDHVRQRIAIPELPEDMMRLLDGDCGFPRAAGAT